MSLRSQSLAERSFRVECRAVLFFLARTLTSANSRAEIATPCASRSALDACLQEEQLTANRAVLGEYCLRAPLVISTSIVLVCRASRGEDRNNRFVHRFSSEDLVGLFLAVQKFQPTVPPHEAEMERSESVSVAPHFWPYCRAHCWT